MQNSCKHSWKSFLEKNNSNLECAAEFLVISSIIKKKTASKKKKKKKKRERKQITVWVKP